MMGEEQDVREMLEHNSGNHEEEDGGRFSLLGIVITLLWFFGLLFLVV